MISQNVNKSVKGRKKNKLDKAFATQLQFTNFRYDDISPLFGEGKLGLLQPKMRKGHHNHFSIEMMTLIYQKKTSASPISNYSPGAIFYGTLGTQFELQSRN